MMIDISFFYIYAGLSFILFCGLFLVASLRKGRPVSPIFRFSVGRYYLINLPAPLAVLIYSYIMDSWFPIIIFCVFCIMGIIGEVAFSLWWQHYYKDPFWIYTTKTLINRYTSSLNIVSWGVGGFLYMVILDNFPSLHSWKIPQSFISLFIIAALIQIVVFFLACRTSIVRNKFEKVNLLNWFFFSLPILIPFVSTTLKYGSIFLVLFIAFGIIGGAVEYSYGKMCEIFLSKNLWKYRFLSIDNGHFTVLSLPAFALGGIYFWTVYEIIKAVLI